MVEGQYMEARLKSSYSREFLDSARPIAFEASLYQQSVTVENEKKFTSA